MKRILILALLTMFAISVGAAPAAKLWSKWEDSDSSNAQRVDHTAFNVFLGKYLDTAHPSGINRVAYGRVTSVDRAGLDSYLEELQSVKVTGLNRNEQQAYWINLYNAFTVKVILDNYPVDSILKISKGLFKTGPWDMKLMRIEGEEVSLNDIEHRVLRPIWKDNRIHYAVNCASLGCPNLQGQAFTAENTDRLLDKAAREYVNHSRGVGFEGSRLGASSIYSWYQVDFGGGKEPLIRHLIEYAEPDLAARLEAYVGSIKYSYDWNLNEE